MNGGSNASARTCEHCAAGATELELVLVARDDGGDSVQKSGREELLVADAAAAQHSDADDGAVQDKLATSQ